MMNAALQKMFEEVDGYYKERGIFQAKFGLGARPALVVIDMAYGWTDPGYAGGSARLDPAIDAIASLLPLARAARIPVAYTTSPWQQKAFKSAADLSATYRTWDQRACEIDGRIPPAPGEYIIYKEHASAFHGTALVHHLIRDQIDTLLITGCSTSACVRATATDAKSYGFKPIIIREAVQDRCELLHEFTLFDIQSRFADVIELQQAQHYLKKLAS